MITKRKIYLCPHKYTYKFTTKRIQKKNGYTYTYIPICMYIRIYVYMCLYIHIHIYLYLCTYMPIDAMSSFWSSCRAACFNPNAVGLTQTDGTEKFLV